MAFIIAGIVFFVTLVVCVFGLAASIMSDSPTAADDISSDVVWWFAGGVALTVLIAATHWLPRIGW